MNDLQRVDKKFVGLCKQNYIGKTHKSMRSLTKDLYEKLRMGEISFTKKINKKGSGILDIVYMVVFLFVCAIVGGISLFIYAEFNDFWQEQEVLADEYSKEEAQAFGDLFSAVLDGGIILWLFIIWLGALVTSFYLDNSPVFYIIFLLLSLLTLFALLPFGTFYGEFTETGFESGFSQMPMTNFVFTNLIYFLIGFIVSNGIALYAKFRLMGGGVQ